ncbi:MAG: 50S ribosomal protein L13 [Candidatus Omnitrophota bacterium]|nr:50S ribosomal protein L13 [Candidatus Omnitrophota bacterium]
MKKTFMARKDNIKQAWYLIDAKGKILGRLASQVARILRGKHKPSYTPHVDTGDNVIVINAKDIVVTGRKLTDKIYRRYSGYPGGLREVPLEVMLRKNPAQVIRLAVKRMLPSGPLGRKMVKKLRVFADEKFIHQAQKPVKLAI